MSQLPHNHGRHDFGPCVVVLRGPTRMLCALFCQVNAVLYKYATSRSDRHQRRARNDTHSASINSTAARRVLLNIGSARLKFVAEFLIKTEKEDLMKYLLLIATLAACISTATATSPAADCCKGNGKCCPGKCCKK